MAKQEKGGLNLDKNTGSKIDLDKGKEMAQQAADAVNENMEEMVDEVRDAVPVEDAPADIELPKADRDLKKALETGDIEPPRKKNYAWLWAIIGIAIVLAFIAMLLNRGKKASDITDDNTPAMFVSGDSASDSAVAANDEPVADSAQSVIGTVAENAVSEVSTVVSEGADKIAAKTEDAVNAASSKVEGTVNASNAVSGVTGSVETAASDVIKGDFGNGNVRKERLGARYQEIQNMVNQMKRQGKF